MGRKRQSIDPQHSFFISHTICSAYNSVMHLDWGRNHGTLTDKYTAIISSPFEYTQLWTHRRESQSSLPRSFTHSPHPLSVCTRCKSKVKAVQASVSVITLMHPYIPQPIVVVVYKQSVGYS